MRYWKNSTVIHAPIDQVFAYVDDTRTLGDWFPSLIEVRNLVGAGAGHQFEWTYKMVGVLLTSQSVVVEHVPNECATHQSIGMIHSTFTYCVEPHGDGTLLTIDLAYSIPFPVLGKVAEHITERRNAREFDLALINVKELLEG